MPRRLSLLLLLCLTASLWAIPEPSADELAAAQHRYAQWRRHPEQLAKLQANWHSFLALPAERREQLVQLDRDLHDEPSSVQARLWNALERYVEWLERLPEEDRAAVKQAPDKAARLEMVRELRDRDWMKGQPRVLRQQWAQLQGKERADFVQKLRAQERQRHVEWQIAGRFWRELEMRQALPARLSDLERNVQEYVADILMPMLDAEEKDRLKKAEGSWPGYPLTLVELADRHPPALPGPNGPRTVAELPRQMQKQIENMKNKTLLKFLKPVEGQWPQFAIAVTEHASGKKGWTGLGHELWPCNYKGLQPAMQKFVADVLEPVLTSDEKLRLLRVQDKWPDYPLHLQEFARNHDLQAPWHTLPHSGRDRLDAYRLQREPRVDGFPDLPAVNLRQFALYELDPRERARLSLSPNDPGSFQRLVQAYFTHRQHELKRLRMVDQNRHKPGRPGQ